MRLFHHGVPYVPTPAIPTRPGQAIGKYRGATLFAQHPIPSLVVQPASGLKYRGAEY
jgi:hypothetical protein